MTIQLDGNKMRSRADAHDHLKQQLSLPDYYGRNLDALYDLLTGMGSSLTIVLQNQSDMLNSLGNYGDLLIETLQQAAEDNPNLHFSIL